MLQGFTSFLSSLGPEVKIGAAAVIGIVGIIFLAIMIVAKVMPAIKEGKGKDVGKWIGFCILLVIVMVAGIGGLFGLFNMFVPSNIQRDGQLFL